MGEVALTLAAASVVFIAVEIEKWVKRRIGNHEPRATVNSEDKL